LGLAVGLNASESWAYQRPVDLGHLRRCLETRARYLPLAGPDVDESHLEAETDLLGEFGEGHSPVLLKFGKDRSVYGVHVDDEASAYT
jgi:hypothetical protein